MAKAFMAMGVDTTEASALVGFLQTLSTEVKTTRHIGPVLKYTHAIMSEEFTDHMSVIAPSQSSRFHHVYEWGMVGNPLGKLWTDRLVGGGNNRIATFQWRASKKVVPVREDFQAVGVKQIHVFVWKAPVMESGVSLEIAPKRGKVLAYFTGPTTPEGKYEMAITSNPIRVENPGGVATTGAFTREYVSWWSGSGAEATFERRVRRVLEEDLGKMPIEETTMRYRRPRTKVIGMKAVADAEAAQRFGAAAAKKYLQARSANYIAQARARERLIYGD
ncbi:hypothetical protein PP459_gp211 [Streptomyces phage Wakanda]|uniref:Uncharacterized protein n=2 Tax=Wakandavirus TaxID=3044854 RepID=A0A6G8R309_9CAUD|nr:hypothetical protein PP459_gp211 [Streptomyces phage Wakanda]YP_010652341.1 hypothetical protein PP460_gp217 [Streptomyces phage Muntaha]QIN94023.1 hypothetical protein SEA_WAKANDA_30 [Streptomyces phage Wakanda]QIN94587.1 hypothetical protein SEA_MUNTAHA_30 [Streptomyces phage Muntaha]